MKFVVIGMNLLFQRQQIKYENMTDMVLDSTDFKNLHALAILPTKKLRKVLFEQYSYSQFVIV